MPGKNGGSEQDILHVDPDAVPGLRTAFANALARVDRQLELVDKELRITSWAKDPVSLGATKLFNSRALDADFGAAVDMLRAYREQLDTAVQNLDMNAEQYRTTDQDNAIGVRRSENG